MQCGRQMTASGECLYCGYGVCGVHSIKLTRTANARRFCEICGSTCAHSGECPVHGFNDAKVRSVAALKYESTETTGP